MECSSVVRSYHVLSSKFYAQHHIKLGMGTHTCNTSEQQAVDFKVLGYSKLKASLSYVKDPVSKTKEEKG